jgi:hypothetical protein
VVKHTSLFTEGSSSRDDLSAIIGGARLIGTVTDAIAEVLILAETGDIGSTAAQRGRELEHVGNAGYLPLKSR